MDSSPYTLQWAAPYSPSHEGSGPQCKTGFLGPTRVDTPNGISISSAVFARLTAVTDRQTDRQTTLLRL